MKTKTTSFTVQRLSGATAACNALLCRSVWFSVTPLPDDEYEITVKDENQPWLQSVIFPVRLECHTNRLNIVDREGRRAFAVRASRRFTEKGWHKDGFVRIQFSQTFIDPLLGAQHKLQLRGIGVDFAAAELDAYNTPGAIPANLWLPAPRKVCFAHTKER